jgi:hypothetical protein
MFDLFLHNDEAGRLGSRSRGLGEAFDADVLAGVPDESFEDMLKIERITGTGTPLLS